MSYTAVVGDRPDPSAALSAAGPRSAVVPTLQRVTPAATVPAPAAASDAESYFSSDSMASPTPLTAGPSSSLAPPNGPVRQTSESSSAADSYGEDWLDRFRARVAVRMRAILAHPLTDRIAQIAYTKSLWINLVFFIVVIVLCNALNPAMLRGVAPVRAPLSGLLVVVALLQSTLCALSHVPMVLELSTQDRLQPWAIWNMYMSCVMTYGTIYFTVFAKNRDSFDLHGYAPDDAVLAPGSDMPAGQSDQDFFGGAFSDTTRYNDPVSVYIFCTYFSSAIITSTGFGDIVPKLWHAQMLCNSQMLVGLIYSVGVFGLALDHFMRMQLRRKRAEARERQRIRREKQEMNNSRRTLLVASSSSSPQQPSSSFAAGSGAFGSSQTGTLSSPTHVGGAYSLSPGAVTSPLTPGTEPPQRVSLHSAPANDNNAAMRRRGSGGDIGGDKPLAPPNLLRQSSNDDEEDEVTDDDVESGGYDEDDDGDLISSLHSASASAGASADASASNSQLNTAPGSPELHGAHAPSQADRAPPHRVLLSPPTSPQPLRPLASHSRRHQHHLARRAASRRSSASHIPPLPAGTTAATFAAATASSNARMRRGSLGDTGGSTGSTGSGHVNSGGEDEFTSEYFHGLGVLEPMDMTIAHPPQPHHQIAADGLASAPGHPVLPLRPLIVPSATDVASMPAPRVSPSMSENSIAAAVRAGAPVSLLHVTALLPFWARWKRNERFETWRRRVIKWLLPVEFTLNLLCCSMLLLVPDPFTGISRELNTEAEWRGKIVILVCALLLLILQCALNLACTLRLLHKIAGGSFKDVLDRHGRVVARLPREGVTFSFLVSSYLSTVICFGSLYFFLFAFAPTHEFSLDRHFDMTVPSVWYTMQYFSMTAMTGVGFGDLFARGVLSRMVCFVEMLISIGYTSVFIGLGMWVLCEQMDEKAKKDLIEKDKKIQVLVQNITAVRMRTAAASSSGSVSGASAAPSAVSSPRASHSSGEHPSSPSWSVAVTGIDPVSIAAAAAAASIAASSSSGGSGDEVEPPLLELLHRPELLRDVLAAQAAPDPDPGLLNIDEDELMLTTTG